MIPEVEGSLCDLKHTGVNSHSQEKQGKDSAVSLGTFPRYAYTKAPQAIAVTSRMETIRRRGIIPLLGHLGKLMVVLLTPLNP